MRISKSGQASIELESPGWASKLHTIHDRGEAGSIRCGIQTRLPLQQRCPTNLQFNSAPQNRTIFEDLLPREDPKDVEARSGKRCNRA